MVNNIDEGVAYYVEVKAQWGQSWESASYLYPEYFEREIAPGIGRASLIWHAGQIKPEDDNEFLTRTGVDIIGWYVRIWTNYNNEGLKLRWLGIIIDSQELLRDSAGAIFDQKFTAYELSYMLDRIPVDRAFCRSPSGNGPIPIYGISPTFNKKNEYGGKLTGNRSPAEWFAPPFFGIHYFYERYDAVVWSAYDVLLYLVRFLLNDPGSTMTNYQFVATEFTNNVYLTGDYPYLDGIFRVWDFSERTVWDALNQVINRSQGFTFNLIFDQNDQLAINVKSVSLNAITIGPATIPANTDTTSLILPVDHPFTHLVDDLSVRRNYTSTYGLVEVIGGPISVTTTYEVGADKELVPAWDLSLEADYKDIEGDDADAKDRRRADEKWEGFYTKFIIKDEWDGSVTRLGLDPLYIIPVVDPVTGEISYPQSPSDTWWLGEKRFEREIHLAAGYDYSTDPPDFGGAEHLDNELMPMMGFIRDMLDGDQHDATEEWIPLDRVSECIPEVSSSYSIMPLDKQMGVQIGCSPRHLLGLGFFGDDKETNVYPEFSYLSLRVTATLKTDARLSYRAIINPDFKHKKLTILVPDAEAWAVLPNTIVGGPSGQTYSGSLYVRDDRPMVEAIAAGAVAWYNVEHKAISIDVQRVDEWVFLGQILTNVTGISTSVAVNSVITGIKTDITSGRTTIETNWGENDFAPDFASFFTGSNQ